LIFTHLFSKKTQNKAKKNKIFSKKKKKKAKKKRKKAKKNFKNTFIYFLFSYTCKLNF
jgi:hypothetical protein